MTVRLMMFLAFLGAPLYGVQGQALSIRVGTDPTFAPMEYYDGSGHLTGFEIDLMNLLARTGGFTVTFMPVSWDGIFTNLKKKQYDAILSSVSMTGTRQAVFLFSDPYFNGGQAICVPQGSPELKLDDLTGKRIGVQAGTTGNELAKWVDDAYIHQYDDTDAMFLGLKNKDVDAVVCDLAVIVQYQMNPDYTGLFQLASGPIDTDTFGVVLLKDNRALADRLNTALRAVKANGMYDRLLSQWHLRQ